MAKQTEKQSSPEVLEATEDRLIVRRRVVKMTPGGLELPEGDNKKKIKEYVADVISVGPLAREEYKEGDVIFAVRTGVEFDFGGNTLIALRKSEVVAKVKGQ